MGDHQASIKIEMEFHGIKDKRDMHINYFPRECCGMDERVTEFFNSVYERGMVVYERETAEYYAEENKKQIEESERKELERLKAKYEAEGRGA